MKNGKKKRAETVLIKLNGEGMQVPEQAFRCPYYEFEYLVRRERVVVNLEFTK